MRLATTNATVEMDQAWQRVYQLLGARLQDA